MCCFFDRLLMVVLVWSSKGLPDSAQGPALNCQEVGQRDRNAVALT